MLVQDACAEIREKLNDTLLKGLGNTEEYGLFQSDKDDPKKGWWLEPKKPFSYYMLENRVGIKYETFKI